MLCGAQTLNNLCRDFYIEHVFFLPFIFFAIVLNIGLIVGWSVVGDLN